MTVRIIHTQKQGPTALEAINKQVALELDAGKKVFTEVKAWEEKKLDIQRNYYHGIVLKTIAGQAMIDGKKYSLKSWKEYFRAEYLGEEIQGFDNPMTGKYEEKVVRISSEDLSIREYAKLIEKVTAFAVTDLDVRFMAFDKYAERMGW